MRDDTWLAEIVGQPVFRLDPGDLDGDGVRAVEAHIRGQARGFYYAKVDAEDVNAARRLGSGGFFVADTNITFELDRPAEMSGGSPGVTVGDLEPGDEAGVLDVAATAFRVSRFHLDPFIETATANAIKRAWCESYVRKLRGDKLFVARRESRPAGFLAALTAEAHGRRIAVIDLIGVAPADQRHRVGAALNGAFVEHYRPHTAALRVGTQVGNIPAVRFYERSGFSLVSSQYVMHLHVQAGRPLT
jgi:dTDP-4-amino-4,6-dideoxy-D-galactose acyltransferase